MIANGRGGDGRTDGRMEIPPCVLQDIGPLGPLPKKGQRHSPTKFSTLIVEIHYHFMLKNALNVAYITEFRVFLSEMLL